MATQSLEDALSRLKSIKSQDDIISFFNSPNAERLKQLLQQCFEIANNNKDNISTVLSTIKSLYPNPTTSSSTSTSQPSNNNLSQTQESSKTVSLLHHFFTAELFLVGAILVFTPKLMLQLLQLSEPYHASVSDDNSDTQLQFMRVLGGMCIVLAIHYYYEIGNPQGMKAAAVGRLVFASLLAYMLKQKWIENPFGLFVAQDITSGLLGLFKSSPSNSKL